MLQHLTCVYMVPSLAPIIDTCPWIEPVGELSARDSLVLLSRAAFPRCFSRVLLKLSGMSGCAVHSMGKHSLARDMAIRFD